jgi:membrane protease YdiL (CAAX protease family)
LGEVGLSAKFRPAGALLLLFVYYGAYMAAILLGGLVSEGDHVGVLFFAAAAVVAPLCATYVGLNRYAAEEPTRAALRLDRPRGRDWIQIGLAVVAGATLAPLAVELRVAMQQLMPLDALPADVQAELDAALAQTGSQVGLALAELALIPFAQEVLLRGLIQPRLEAPLGRWRALAATALLSMLAALHPFVMPGALVLAVPLGLLAMAAGTWAAIAARIAVGLAPVALALVGQPLPDVDAAAPGHVAPAALVASTLVAAAAVLVAWRRRRR